MEAYKNENLCHDPIHGYICFVGSSAPSESEICERQIIDAPWVQRMRQIRQLQTAWWVFPTAEHSRFQHILGVMHLASRAVGQLYESLQSVDPSVPSLPYIDSLMRMAGLLHDVGHGPFGHFFDANFLAQYELTHETLGGHIIETQLGMQLRQIRRSPAGSFAAEEVLNPSDIAWLIRRPTAATSDSEEPPLWLSLLQSLFCGIYTIDNMDFVLRDAFMTGVSPRSFDLDRLLHYSQFTAQGLTLHDRGMPALVHFLGMKAELFRSVYFHRTIRAIDIELAELFRLSRRHLFPGDPRDHLQDYLELTEFSLLSRVASWRHRREPELQQLGKRWQAWLNRRVPWVLVCGRTVSFAEGQSESSSVFSSGRVLKETIRARLPNTLAGIPFEIDLARHIHRPHTLGATAGMNFYYDSSANRVRPLSTHELYQKLPISHTIARIYAHDYEHQAALTRAMDQVLGTASQDDFTNM